MAGKKWKHGCKYLKDISWKLPEKMSCSEQFSGTASTDLGRKTAHGFCGHNFTSMSYHWAPGLPSMFQGFPVSWFPSPSCRRKRLLCGRYDTQARRQWSGNCVGHIHTDDIWERTLWVERTASTREEFLACSRDKGSERLAGTECEEEKERVQRSDGVAGSGPVCDMGLEHLKELPFTVE